MKTYSIRPATEADLPAVRALLQATWHATYDPIFGAEQVAAISAQWHALDALRADLRSPRSVFLVARDGTSILGTASARNLTSGDVTLGRLYVLPTAQGYGIGTALLDAVLAAFDDVRRVTLDVEPRNFGAIAFYEHHGFHRIAIEERENAGVKEPTAVFEKHLTPK